MPNVARKLDIGIVGCGIAGPAAALFLARHGHKVQIFERAEEVGPAGAGILLAPTALFVLEHRRLLDPVLRTGSKVTRLEGHNERGRKILDIRYHTLKGGLFGVGIHRGALFQILLDATVGAGIPIERGFGAVEVDGNCIVDADGRRRGPFDAIIVADGAKSALRRSLGLEIVNRPYPYGALWTSVQNWGDAPDNVLRQFYSGTGKVIGLLPSGRMSEAEGKLVSLFWSIPIDGIGNWRDNGLAAWKEEVARLAPEAGTLLEQVCFPEQVTVASYFDSRVKSPVSGNVALIGDAAHAMSPQLGQGASLGLYDAMILARCLERDDNVQAALFTYREQRRHHAAFYQAASKWMTPLFQSNLNWLAPPRDLLMGPLCKLPFVRREMVKTMAGVKTGPFHVLRSAEEILEIGSRCTLRLPDATSGKVEQSQP